MSFRKESLFLCGKTSLVLPLPRGFSYLSVNHIAIAGVAETGSPLARLWGGG